MGSSSSSSSSQRRSVNTLQLWKQTIEAVEEYELDAWQAMAPSDARLVLYWVQMVLCLVETLPRVMYHGMMAVMVLPLALCSQLGLNSVQSEQQRRARAQPGWRPSALLDGPPADDESDHASDTVDKGLIYCLRLPILQSYHHYVWTQLYIEYLLPAIMHNLRNIWEPFFADGVDVSIYRPPKPSVVDSDGCCGSLCKCDCDCKCDQCDRCSLVQFSVRFFLSSYFFLSGYRSLQCGICVGPCARPCCYDPCRGAELPEDGFADEHRCQLCEPVDVLLLRWLKEAHEAKAQRSCAFYDARPALMRPPSKLLAPPRRSTVSLAAPTQMSIADGSLAQPLLRDALTRGDLRLEGGVQPALRSGAACSEPQPPPEVGSATPSKKRCTIS